MNKDIVPINDLIGKTVLSRSTGNKLGEVYDLYIDPIEGLLIGVTIKAVDGVMGGLEYKDIYSFGQDAVMAENDEAITPLQDDWLEGHSHAKKHLIGVKIVTESGKLLGNVGDIYVQLTPPPYVIYEVRESVFDKLLGRSFFMYASAGSALSNNAERIVVPNATAANASSSLTELSSRPKPVIGNTEIAAGGEDESETIIRP
jgi:uncharacterized protein YrrD